MQKPDERGVVLVSVIVIGIIVSLLVAGALEATADELKLLRAHKDFLQARYAADAGASLILAFLTTGNSSEIGPSGRVFPISGGTVTVRRVRVGLTTIEYQATGRTARARVSVQLLVDRDAPHRVRAWIVQP